MLAFTPGIPSGYNIILTILSLVAAVLLTGAGLAMSLIPDWRAGPWVGGAIVAGGIAAMHYTGMAAFEIAGVILWDPVLVVTSIVLGAAIGAVALPVGLHGKEEKWKIGGALLLTLAICSHHFTAMGAVSIIPDPTIEVSASALPAGWLAVGVAVASFAIIALALAGVVLDIRDRRRSELEVDRMRDLANASVEGLLVCDGETIVSVNTSFAALIGLPVSSLVGTRLETRFPDEVARNRLLSAGLPVETTLRHFEGSLIPVELILRPIIFAGRPHQVIAVRDLQARKDAEQHIHYLAHHDALTSLPNRGHFNERIDQEIAALKKGESLAVLCLDLDRFKEVNDLFGHAAGDTVLQAVAARVTAVLGESQMMARLGGDEFVVLLPGVTNPAAASRLAESILEALRSTSDTPETNSISTSIGIALYPDDATDRQTLLTHADAALYRAKAERRNTYRFFEARMGADVRERRMLEHDLRLAVARGAVRRGASTPKKESRRQAISGFETFLRWTPPTRGEISPAIFIPIAEETGAILEIGDWVLKSACREAATWTRPLTVAVNVSAVQLYNADFVKELHQTLLETGLPPRRLEIEITETALVRDFNRALATLRQIKALGIGIAMDDFGTGYSSLSNLRAFPFDKIKIDGSFIKSVNCNDQAATIVRAVLGLGRGLGLPVLAEGVETEAELQFLQNELCDQVQGYLLGRPAAIGSFRNLTHGDIALDASDHSFVSQAKTA